MKWGITWNNKTKFPNISKSSIKTWDLLRQIINYYVCIIIDIAELDHVFSKGDSKILKCRFWRILKHGFIAIPAGFT
jgi:hypothetical protein